MRIQQHPTTQRHGSEESRFGTAEPHFEALPANRLWSIANLPPRLWVRIAVVLVALVTIKIALLLTLGKHLNQIHWRTLSTDPTWVNSFAFLVFVALGVWGLLGLAEYCRSLGVHAVRSANAAVLSLALLFIFLTFHSGTKNYLYPVMTGVLSWKSLGPYLSLDLFFRPPWLAVWLAGYAGIYYLLVRTGHEWRALHVTAAFAVGYAVLCLRELAFHRDELLVADCLGVVSLLISRRRGYNCPSGLVLAPAVWSMAFAWVLFEFGAPQETDPIRYFAALAAATLLLFSFTAILARNAGFLAYWKNWQLFYAVSFLLGANSYYPSAVNFNNALCLGFELPRYFWGEAALAALLAFGGVIYVRLWPKRTLLWMDVAGLGLIAMAFADLRLAGIMGVRLDWDLISFSMTPGVMWRMAKPYLPTALSTLGAIVLVYAGLVRTLPDWGGRRVGSTHPRATAWARWCAAVTLGLLGALGLALANPDIAEGQATLRLAQTSPWWKRVTSPPLTRNQFLHSAAALGLGDFAAARVSQAARPRRDLNVVLIFLESSYNKHLSLFGSSEKTQPLLSKYRDRMELFPNFFSAFAGSIQAEFAAFTSLYPVRDYNLFTLQRVQVKSLFEVMHDNGYACSLFFSSSFDYAGFRNFIEQRGVDELCDMDNMPGQRKAGAVSWGLPEGETLEAIRARIDKQARANRRFFLTYVPVAPHYPYDGVPPAFRRFKKAGLGDYSSCYLNELLYMDWVMAAIVEQLQQSGVLDRTLVIITNDHGEQLGEHGGPKGHGWALTPELANTPLIVMDPQQKSGRINYTIGSHVDLLPTILDLLGIPLPKHQLYQGRSLYTQPPNDSRLVYLNSYEQYGIISGNHYFSGSRKADEARGSAPARSVYVISNQGSKTCFTEDKALVNQRVSIQAFDQFQVDLLRNYGAYCEAVWGRSQAGAAEIATADRTHTRTFRP